MALSFFVLYALQRNNSDLSLWNVRSNEAEIEIGQRWVHGTLHNALKSETNTEGIWSAKCGAV